MVVEKTRTFAKRWFILVLFCSLSMTNAFQWLQYSIINNLLIQYYNVDSVAIDWTSIIYNLVYIPFIFPASWLLDKYGLRLTLILGSCLNCFATWIKCGSTDPSRFYVTFIGQTVASLSQVFILGVPPKLAAVWFGPLEVSTATAVGVFGNQVGCALGFLIPPNIVKNVSKLDSGNYSSELFSSTVTNQLQVMFFGTAAITSLICVLIILFLPNKPALPPSLAQMAAIEHGLDQNFLDTLKQFFTHLSYMLLVVTYGINVGVFYTLSTFLNPILIRYFPGEEENIGAIGLTLVVCGMVGTVVCGIWLDRTKRYKLANIVVYALSFVGMIVFTFTIGLGRIWIVFLVAALLGFFVTGYLPLGFEYGSELTYPLSENTSSGLLNASAMVFGTVLTLPLGFLVKIKMGAFYTNLTLSIALAVGTLVTLAIKGDLRRHNAELAHSKNNAQINNSDFTITSHNTTAYVNSSFELDGKEAAHKNNIADNVS